MSWFTDWKIFPKLIIKDIQKIIKVQQQWGNTFIQIKQNILNKTNHKEKLRTHTLFDVQSRRGGIPTSS